MSDAINTDFNPHEFEGPIAWLCCVWHYPLSEQAASTIKDVTKIRTYDVQVRTFNDEHGIEAMVTVKDDEPDEDDFFEEDEDLDTLLALVEDDEENDEEGVVDPKLVALLNTPTPWDVGIDAISGVAARVAATRVEKGFAKLAAMEDVAQTEYRVLYDIVTTCNCSQCPEKNEHNVSHDVEFGVATTKADADKMVGKAYDIGDVNTIVRNVRVQKRTISEWA